MTPEALEPMESSPEEISELLRRYETALEDAQVRAQSVDGRYVDACTAGFLLAKVVVRSAGHRVRGGENHLDTLRAVPWVKAEVAAFAERLGIAPSIVVGRLQREKRIPFNWMNDAKTKLRWGT